VPWVRDGSDTRVEITAEFRIQKEGLPWSSLPLWRDFRVKSPVLGKLGRYRRALGISAPRPNEGFRTYKTCSSCLYYGGGNSSPTCVKMVFSDVIAVIRKKYRVEKLVSDFIPSLKEPVPQVLWVGCSDSWITEVNSLDLLPEETFVHRNLGTCLSNGDLSSTSAIEYCVNLLEVSQKWSRSCWDHANYL
jgi:hypothetical protein